jgi:hypothetical protein
MIFARALLPASGRAGSKGTAGTTGGELGVIDGDEPGEGPIARVESEGEGDGTGRTAVALGVCVVPVVWLPGDFAGSLDGVACAGGDALVWPTTRGRV